MDELQKEALAGCRVIVTRALDQAADLCFALAKHGAEPILLPAIAFAPPDNDRALCEALHRIETYDRETYDRETYDSAIWSSANAVRFFFKAAQMRPSVLARLQQTRHYAIGPATAATLEHYGLSAAAIAQQHQAEGLWQLLQSEQLSGRRFLFARAQVARDVLPNQLVAAGAVVDIVPVYQTTLPALSQIQAGLAALTTGEFEAITLTSASTVTNLGALSNGEIGRLLSGKIVAVIGEVTAKACMQQGIAVSLMPSHATVDALVDALAEYVMKSHAIS